MYVYCKVAKLLGNLDIARKQRIEDCPLVEVPTPHGSLIDRKVTRDNLMYEMVGTGYQSKAMKICDELYTPTVIEA